MIKKLMLFAIMLILIAIPAMAEEGKIVQSQYPEYIANLGIGERVYDVQDNGGSYLKLVRSTNDLEPAFIIGGTKEVKTKIGDTIDITLTLRGSAIDGQPSHVHKLTVYSIIDGNKVEALPATPFTVGWNENKDVTLQLKVPEVTGNFQYVVSETIELQRADCLTCSMQVINVRGDNHYISILIITGNEAPSSTVQEVSEAMKAANGTGESAMLGKKVVVISYATPKPTSTQDFVEISNPTSPYNAQGEDVPAKTEQTPATKTVLSYVTRFFSGGTPVPSIEATTIYQPKIGSIEFKDFQGTGELTPGKLESNLNNEIGVYLNVKGTNFKIHTFTEIDIRKRIRGWTDADSKYVTTLSKYIDYDAMDTSTRTENMGSFRFNSNNDNVQRAENIAKVPVFGWLVNKWGSASGSFEPYEYYASEIRMDGVLVYKATDNDARTRVVLQK